VDMILYDMNVTVPSRHVEFVMYVDASGIRLPFHYFYLIIVSCIHVLNVYNMSILVYSVHIIFVLIVYI
jgi:hypothetical protein